MTAPVIRTLPDAPQRADEPATFVTKADAWVADIAGWTEDANAFGDFLNGYTPTGVSSNRTIMLSITGTALTASEVLGAIMPPTGETWTFPANLSTSSGKKLSGGVNPASTYTLDVKKNGSSVGTISISTSGVVTFSTSGGTSFSLTGGSDELQAVGHATPDTAVGYVITLVATWA